jgi:hypothetical protein
MTGGRGRGDGEGDGDGEGEGEGVGFVGFTGSLGGGGAGAGADSVGRTGRLSFRTSRRWRGSRLGATARSCSATPAAAGTSIATVGGGGGGTTTGPSEGGAMNGVVPLASTESPTFAEPLPMAAMIGSDDMVASMTTITVYRLVGPARPAARCSPATRRAATCVPPVRRWRTSSGTGLSPDCGTTEAPLRQGPHTGWGKSTHSATTGGRVNVPTFGLNPPNPLPLAILAPRWWS